MPILRPTNIQGRVEAVLVNPDRDATLEKGRVDEVRATYEGFEGDCHSGLTRGACVRVKAQYAKGTEIRNTRQISVLSAEELGEVADMMGISGIEPEWVGANLLLSGIPDFTLLPPSSRLIFDSGASLVVDMENGPCKFPGDVIEEYHPGKGGLFANKARGKRGVTCWVEREGVIRSGDKVALHIPPQRIWEHA